MYSSERIQKNVKKADVSFLTAGIHEDVKLDGAKFDTSPNSGNKFLEISFSKDGKKFTHTEWEPKKFGDETEESFQKKCDNQGSRMFDILKCFYKEDELNFNGESFEMFARWIAEKLENADKSKLVRLKIVYNNSGYTTLPKYAKFTFIEPMTITKEDSHISELSIDVFTRPVVADKEVSNTNPFQTTEEVATQPVNDPNGLPF